MRILFVCNEYPPAPHGGIGVFVKTLAEALVQEGHAIAVIGYDPAVQEHTIVQENGVEVFRIHLKSYPALKIGRFTLSLAPILSRYNLSSEIEKVISVFKPDLLESFDWGGPLWEKPSVSLVVRIHGANTACQLYENKKASRLLYYFEKKNILFADSICSVSKHIGKLTFEALNIQNKRYSLIYNFVDTTIFKRDESTAKNPNKILYVGRIHPRKGIAELFKIIENLFALDKDLFLELAGPFQPEYQTKLLDGLSAQLCDRVKFLGKISHDQLPKLYSSAGLFLMPSRAEAFGLTAIEAMACGVPVFMTNRASGPEIVKDGETGWLFDIDDAISTAYRIKAILNDTGLIARVTSKALQEIEKNYAKDIILQQNVNFYKALLH